MNTIKDYIEQNLDKELTLDLLAEKAGYSKFHLNRLFTEQTGETIHQYIKRRRLEQSAHRLTTEPTTVTDIALDAGYQSLQAFSLAFRRMYHCTPSDFRKLTASICMYHETGRCIAA